MQARAPFARMPITPSLARGRPGARYARPSRLPHAAHRSTRGLRPPLLALSALLWALAGTGQAAVPSTERDAHLDAAKAPFSSRRFLGNHPSAGHSMGLPMGRSAGQLAPASTGHAGVRHPQTRSGVTAAARTSYDLPWRAALSVSYHYSEGRWGGTEHTGELAYNQQIRDWTLDASYRYYRRDRSRLAPDPLPWRDAGDFLARDKQASSFSTQEAGVGVSYAFFERKRGLFKRSAMRVAADLMRFRYDNRHELHNSAATADIEDRYEFDAMVLQVLFSVYY